jgi:DNA processing protein
MGMTEESLAYLQLSLVRGVGPVLLSRLVAAAGSAREALVMARGNSVSVEGIGRKKADELKAGVAGAVERAKVVVGDCERLGYGVLTPADGEYPVALLDLPDRPGVLFVWGALEPRDLNAFAIVGARACSNYGREQAERFGLNLAACGMTVVSGGARGIDSAAHRGALMEPAGRTICVVGSGLDVFYPPENEGLFNKIAQRGAVVSEYVPGSSPEKQNFLRRNRIIAGLSRGVLVVEADEHSGALVTCRVAVEDYNRPVFALPGRIDNPLSFGPHKFIREGAVLVSCLDDLLSELGPVSAAAVSEMAARPSGDIEDGGLFDRQTEPAAGREPAAEPERESAVELAGLQKQVFEALGREELSVDELVEKTGLEAGAIQAQLTMLAIKTVVKRVDGQKYARKR